MSNTASLYDAYYYDHCCGAKAERNEQWLSFFDYIAGRIASDIRPASVLDAGCGMGFLVEGLRKRGVEAYGIDISEYAIQRVHESVRDYCRSGSVTEPFPRRYDVIVTIEVLEHLPAREADQAIENLCHHTDRILFSSSPLDYTEVTHFNVQPPEYWAALFARHGFYRDMELDATFITPWAVCFERRQVVTWQLITGYERLLWQRTQNADAQRKVNLQQRDALARAEQLVAEERGRSEAHQIQSHALEQVQAELAARQQWQSEIEASLGWAVLTRLHRIRAFLAPPGSARDRLVKRCARAVLGPNHRPPE